MPHRMTPSNPFSGTQSNFLRLSQPVRFLFNIYALCNLTFVEINKRAGTYHPRGIYYNFFGWLLAECGGTPPGSLPQCSHGLGGHPPGRTTDRYQGTRSCRIHPSWTWLVVVCWRRMDVRSVRADSSDSLCASGGHRSLTLRGSQPKV